MILEGIVTTVDAAGALNVAPMGPVVPDAEPWSTFVLRPFAGSRTYANLLATGVGVLHATDDVLLLAQAAVGEVQPPTVPAASIPGRRLADCCRWWEFRIAERDAAGARATLHAVVTAAGVGRPWRGFNRAVHATLEAAILATRVGILPAEEINAGMQRLRIPVEKTAGPREREAFALLERTIAERQR